MSNWNDDRLDKRDEEVKEGFGRLESQIKDGFAETDKRFARLEDQIMANCKETSEGFAEVRSEMSKGFAEMHSAYVASSRTLLLVAGGIMAALIGVIGALVVALAA